jgi:DNA-binding SARP family transcriptional activator
MKFRLLGPTEILHHDQWIPPGGLRAKALISGLLLRANRTADARWLMRLMWPTGEPASANANLRQYVAKLRQALRGHSLDDVARLRSAAPGYRLEVARDELDLTLFQDLAMLGRQALAAQDLPAARGHLARAVGLWQGELCESLPTCPELLAEQAYWEELRLLASQSLMTARLGLGEHGEATAELFRLTAEHPLREEFSGMLMLSLYRCHRRSDALEVFARTRSLLVSELGIEPGPYLRDLQQAILSDDPTLVSGVTGWLTSGAGRPMARWPSSPAHPVPAHPVPAHPVPAHPVPAQPVRRQMATA